MNKRKIALGPGAASLILIVVVLSLCMMAMLTQISARNDYNLCTRSAEMVQRVYELNARSEQKLAELDALLVTAQKDAGSMEEYLEKVSSLLPEGMTLEEKVGQMIMPSYRIWGDAQKNNVTELNDEIREAIGQNILTPNFESEFQRFFL